MLQDQVAVLLEMLAVAHDPPLAGEQLRQSLLAHHQRRRAQIVAVEMQQIEGVVDETVDAAFAQVGLQQREIRRAVLVLDHQLAVDQGGARPAGP